MATSTKYFVLPTSANDLNFLDFDLRYGGITTVGETIQYTGESKGDSIFVRPGLTYDLSDTGTGPDKIYFGGNLADYSASTNGSLLTLARTLASGPPETVTVTGGPNGFDTLVFANGSVSARAFYLAITSGSAPPTPDPVEISTNPQGAAAPGAALQATIKAFASSIATANTVGETFASTRPGINFIAVGGKGIDTVYVADGETVDATVTGTSVDLIYMRGKWADYTKTVSGDILVFTRQVGGVSESVSVAGGTLVNFDRLIFADGSVASNEAKTAITGNPAGGIATIPGYNPNQTTPLFSDPEIAAALATIRDAAQRNIASDTSPTPQVYQTAGVTGVTADNLASISSALNSIAVDGAHAETRQEVQAIVDAYKAILASADGNPTANTTTPITGDQYATVGVTGVSGSGVPALGSALHLLDDAVDHSPKTAVDTVSELQNLLDAAKAVQAQAAGTAGLTMAQLGLLGVTDQNGAALTNSLDASTQAAILAKIAGAADNGTQTDTVAQIQALVNTINHAPRIDQPLVDTSTLGGLFGSTASYGTAIAAPEIQGPGWNSGWPDGSVVQFANTGWNTIHSPDLLSPADNPWLKTLYGIHGVEGTSLNGGNFAAFISQPFADVGSKNYDEGITTTLNGLVAGHTYSFVTQWQQIAYTNKNVEAYLKEREDQLQDVLDMAYDAGGSLTISTTGNAVKEYTSSGLFDGWQTVVYTFQAVGNSATLTVQSGGHNNLADNGFGIKYGAIGVDSLSQQQTQDFLNANPVVSNGLSVGSIFGTTSDTDNGAALKGWAITRAAADVSGHHWQYSSNNGATWANMDAASASQAIYLSTTDLIRWTGAKGANTELDAKAVDDTGPALHASNAAATVVDASASGGASAFSGNTAVLAANAAPLVFDLNLDGKIDYSHISMVMDGQRVDTAWVGPADAILLWNKYGDAQVHGSDQYVFGQHTGSDLSGLQQGFDSNQDFVFDAKDAQFSQFGLWQDANQNGVVDAGEFHSLAQLGISAVSLKADDRVIQYALPSDGLACTPVSGVTVNGNALATLTNGSSMLVADATFSYVRSPDDSNQSIVPYHQPMVQHTAVLL